MISLFREIRITYYVCCFGGLAAIFALFRMFPDHRLIFTVSFIAFIFIVFRVFASISRKKDEKIVRLLTNDCDADSYIAFMEKTVSRFHDTSVKNHINISLANGYLAAGRDCEALTALEKVKNITSNGVPITYRVVYYGLLATYKMRMNDTVAAEEALDTMQQLLDSPVWKHESKDIYVKIYEERRRRLNMAQGNFDGCEAAYLPELENPRNEWEKVAASYFLGETYIHKNNTDKAIEALTYVAKNGGSTIYHKWAAEKLAEMGAVIEAPEYQTKETTLLTKKERILLYFAMSSIMLFAIIMLSMVMPRVLNARYLSEFHPTIAKAFNSFKDGSEHFGDIYESFVTGNTISVLHSIDENNIIQLNIFRTEYINGERVYNFIDFGYLGANINTLSLQDADGFMLIDEFRELLASITTWNLRGMDRVLGRRPLYGTANRANVWELRINDQLVDHVVRFGPYSDGSVFWFWYFADAEVLYKRVDAPDQIDITVGDLLEHVKYLAPIN